MPADHLIAGRFDAERSVDQVTGEQVLITPRGPSHRWLEAYRREQIARRVMALQLPGLVPILHVGPGIVHAAPPRLMTPPRLLPDEAAVCVLEVCEVVAHMHALGVGSGDGLDFRRQHLRLVDRGGSWHVAWLVLVDDLSRRPGGPPERPTVAGDLRHIARFFADVLELRPGASAAELLRRYDLAEAEADALANIRVGDLAGIDDVVALARRFAPLASEWAPRIATWPVVQRLPPPRGLSVDELIAAGEALGVRYPDGVVSRDEHITMPLAAAYHKRAGQRFAARELAAALADVDLAVLHDDEFPPYHTTRAVILDALGRLPEADAAVATAFGLTAPLDAPPPKPTRSLSRLSRASVPRSEHARAHATRGAIAHHQGELAAAEREFTRALELDSTAAHAHALGAVLYARGDIRGAAEFEARALTLPGALARHHWALVVSLQRLGRDAEARAHAQAIVDAEPSVAAHRDRLTRLFPA